MCDAKWAEEVCEDALNSSRLSDWERSFCESIQAQLPNLSDKQVVKLKEVEKKVYAT